MFEYLDREVLTCEELANARTQTREAFMASELQRTWFRVRPEKQVWGHSDKYLGLRSVRKGIGSRKNRAWGLSSDSKGTDVRRDNCTNSMTDPQGTGDSSYQRIRFEVKPGGN